MLHVVVQQIHEVPLPYPTLPLPRSRAQGVADALRAEERELGRNYKWRNAFRRVQEQLLAIEADSKALEISFPQVPLRACPIRLLRGALRGIRKRRKGALELASALVSLHRRLLRCCWSLA